jgi:predicted nucleic acid-binding Zn ribbon protein
MERAGRLIGKLKLSPAVADPQVRACAAWALAAGKKIARHTQAVGLVRGKLVVEVEDYIWQQQLATLQGFLLKNLAEALGEVLVTDLDLRPMPRRRKPQRAETARSSPGGIDDPVIEMLYRESQKKARA